MVGGDPPNRLTETASGARARRSRSARLAVGAAPNAL